LTSGDKKHIDFACSDGLAILSDVLAATEEKKRECLEKRWQYVNKKGEKVVIRDLIDKIVVWVNRFKRIGDIAIQYDPVHAALPWAGVRWLLECVVADSQKFGSVLEGMEAIAHLINKYAIFEDLYLREELSATGQLRHALVKLYTAVLRYLSKAKRYYSMTTAMRMAGSLLSFAEDDFATLLDHIVREQSNVDRYAGLVDAEYQRATYDSLKAADSENQRGRAELKDLLRDLEKPINRVSTQLADLHDNLQSSKRREILNWMSSVPYEQHHGNIRRDRLESSGLWLLHKDEFRLWRKSSTSSILWLHGIPGSGKSKLASLVIDQFLEGHSTSGIHEPLAYFYCARNPGEPERSNPTEIFRSLVRQLSCLKPGLPIMAPITSRYRAREESNFGLTALSLDECLQLILELGKIYPSIIIVIDALDECCSHTRLDLLEVLDDIIQRSASLVKVFVTSREDSDIVCRLETSPNLYIKASDNHKDIERFVPIEVDKSIKSRRLLRGNVSRELRELVVTTLIDGARGM
jgi:hypothetical protein